MDLLSNSKTTSDMSTLKNLSKIYQASGYSGTCPRRWGKKTFFSIDGGTINPTSGWARIATWSAVQDVSISQDQRLQISGFLLGPQPKFPYFKMAALGVVHGEQIVSRGELLALSTATQIACKHEPLMMTEFMTDASYACNVMPLIRSGMWPFFAHKLPNIDLIRALVKI